ncbi:MAG: helix-turn-helix transcriptional regulator [Raoultibacter sp.]
MRSRNHTINLCGILTAIGLALNLVWCTLMGHTIGFLSSATGIESWVNPRTFFLVGILAIGIALTAFPRASNHHDRTLKFVLPLLASGGTGCFGLAFHQDFFDPIALAVAGLFLSGIGYFWLVARYNLLLARTQGLFCAVWSIVGGLLIKVVVVALLGSTLSPEAQVIAAMALPLVSALVFEAARNAAARQQAAHPLVEPNIAPRPVEAKTAFGIPTRPRTVMVSPDDRRNLIILVASVAFLLAAIRASSFLGLWGNTSFALSGTLTWLIGPVIALACLALFAHFFLIKTADYAITTRFQPAILVILAGLFVVAIQANPQSASLALLSDIVQIDELFAHLLFWVVIIAALDALDLPSYRVIGFAGVIYALASIAWVLLLGHATLIDSTLVLLATYVLIVVAMYTSWLGSKKRRRSGNHGIEGATEKQGESNPTSASSVCTEAYLNESIAQRCAELTATYRLSPREKEVFTLLAQGRTRTFIQNELVLSGSTIKTHVSHIYTKMDVHDRQEMMDLILGETH